MIINIMGVKAFNAYSFVPRESDLSRNNCLSQLNGTFNLRFPFLFSLNAISMLVPFRVFFA